MIMRQTMRFVIVLSFLCTAAHVDAQTSTLAIFDGTSSNRALDANGFLLNPAWMDGSKRPNIEERCRFRVSSGELDRRSLLVTRPGCLSDAERHVVTLNEASSVLGVGFICGTSSVIGNLRGHINWFPVTASGLLHWVGYSNGAGDHDLTIELRPPEPNALTAGNAPDFDHHAAYHIEFYHAESLARMNGGSGWWQALNAAMWSKNPDARAHALLDGHFAIVNGTYGLDGVHALQAELHPVYAMAVLLDTLRTSEGHLREEWAIMVRNLGSEGDCSEGQSPLYTDPAKRGAQHFVLDLGWWQGATKPRTSLSDSWSSGSSITVRSRAVESNHLYIDVEHPRPMADRSADLFVGTLAVEWQTDGTTDYATTRMGALWAANEPLMTLSAPRTGGVAPRSLSSLMTLQNDLADSLKREAIASNNQVLQPYTASTLPEIDSTWSPSQTLRATRVEQWMVQSEVKVVDCKSSALAGDRLCLGRFRYIASMSRTQDGSWTPMLGVFVHAHSWGLPGKGELLGDVLAGFAYRFEARMDSFRKETPEGQATYEGVSLRVSPILSPASFRLNSQLTLAPYSIMSPGVSVLHGTQVAPTFASGVGLHALLSGTDAYLEVLRYSRSNRFNGYYAVGFGLMVSPRLVGR